MLTDESKPQHVNVVGFFVYIGALKRLFYVSVQFDRENVLGMS